MTTQTHSKEKEAEPNNKSGRVDVACAEQVSRISKIIFYTIPPAIKL